MKYLILLFFVMSCIPESGKRTTDADVEFFLKNNNCEYVGEQRYKVHLYECDAGMYEITKSRDGVNIYNRITQLDYKSRK